MIAPERTGNKHHFDQFFQESKALLETSCSNKLDFLSLFPRDTFATPSRMSVA